jgi:hypothetical protein
MNALTPAEFAQLNQFLVNPEVEYTCYSRSTGLILINENGMHVISQSREAVEKWLSKQGYGGNDFYVSEYRK